MERSRAPCMPAKRLSIGLSAISVERDGSYFISKEGRRKRRGFSAKNGFLILSFTFTAGQESPCK